MSKDRNDTGKRRARGEQGTVPTQASVDDVFESVDEASEAPNSASLDANGDGVVIDADSQGAPTGSAIVRAADVLPVTLHILPLTHFSQPKQMLRRDCAGRVLLGLRPHF